MKHLTEFLAEANVWVYNDKTLMVGEKTRCSVYVKIYNAKDNDTMSDRISKFLKNNDAAAQVQNRTLISKFFEGDFKGGLTDSILNNCFVFVYKSWGDATGDVDHYFYDIEDADQDSGYEFYNGSKSFGVNNQLDDNKIHSFIEGGELDGKKYKIK